MAKYAWLSDIHLNNLGNDGTTHERKLQLVTAFFESVCLDNPEGVFVTGDISLAKFLVEHLRLLEKIVNCPVFFVLGNHDFWGSDVKTVRNTMKELSDNSDFLKYLTTTSYIRLSDKTCILGHDGFYDMQHGNVHQSMMKGWYLNDWQYTTDFYMHNKPPREGTNKHIIETSQRLASESAHHVADSIKKAVQAKFTNIVILTHVPPFRELHVFNGRYGEDDAAPFYTSKIMGDTLLAAANAYKNVHMTVLCGHTHGKCAKRITDNLVVHVAGADYGRPRVELVEMTI